MKLPFSHAVLRALETAQYARAAPEPGAIAALLGIEAVGGTRG